MLRKVLLVLMAGSLLLSGGKQSRAEEAVSDENQSEPESAEDAQTKEEQQVGEASSVPLSTNPADGSRGSRVAGSRGAKTSAQQRNTKRPASLRATNTAAPLRRQQQKPLANRPSKTLGGRPQNTAKQRPKIKQALGNQQSVGTRINAAKTRKSVDRRQPAKPFSASTSRRLEKSSGGLKSNRPGNSLSNRGVRKKPVGSGAVGSKLSDAQSQPVKGNRGRPKMNTNSVGNMPRRASSAPGVRAMRRPLVEPKKVNNNRDATSRDKNRKSSAQQAPTQVDVGKATSALSNVQSQRLNQGANTKQQRDRNKMPQVVAPQPNRTQRPAFGELKVNQKQGGAAGSSSALKRTDRRGRAIGGEPISTTLPYVASVWAPPTSPGGTKLSGHAVFVAPDIALINTHSYDRIREAPTFAPSRGAKVIGEVAGGLAQYAGPDLSKALGDFVTESLSEEPERAGIKLNPEAVVDAYSGGLTSKDPEYTFKRLQPNVANSGFSLFKTKSESGQSGNPRSFPELEKDTTQLGKGCTYYGYSESPGGDRSGLDEGTSRATTRSRQLVRIPIRDPHSSACTSEGRCRLQTVRLGSSGSCSITDHASPIVCGERKKLTYVAYGLENCGSTVGSVRAFHVGHLAEAVQKNRQELDAFYASTVPPNTQLLGQIVRLLPKRKIIN